MANTIALASPLGCVTDEYGYCIAGEETVGDFLVILRWVDTDGGSNQTVVYTGKPKSPSDFEDTDGDGSDDLASKDFQILKVFRKNGQIQYSRGSKTVVHGSYLEIVYAEFAVWEDVAQFPTDTDWDGSVVEDPVLRSIWESWIVGPDTVPYIANLMPGLFWTDAMFVNAQNIISGEFTGEQAGENAAAVTQRWADQNPDLVEKRLVGAVEPELVELPVSQPGVEPHHGPPDAVVPADQGVARHDVVERAIEGERLCRAAGVLRRPREKGRVEHPTVVRGVVERVTGQHGEDHRVELRDIIGG